MNHTPDSTTTAGNGGTFDPRQAAALLDQTTQQARRKLAPSPPWLLATRAAAVLAALGAIWLSVRGQHPYQGPTGADIPVLLAFIVLNFSATVAVRERAMAGVRGRSRLRPAEITVLVAAFAATVVLMWALADAGVSFAWYPTTVLIIPGLAWAAVAARAGWQTARQPRSPRTAPSEGLSAVAEGHLHHPASAARSALAGKLRRQSLFGDGHKPLHGSHHACPANDPVRVNGYGVRGRLDHQGI
jgi:hypothetical protein